MNKTESKQTSKLRKKDMKEDKWYCCHKFQWIASNFRGGSVATPPDWINISRRNFWERYFYHAIRKPLEREHTRRYVATLRSYVMPSSLLFHKLSNGRMRIYLWKSLPADVYLMGGCSYGPSVKLRAFHWRGWRWESETSYHGCDFDLA